MPAELDALLTAQRRIYREGQAVPASARRDRIQRAIDLLVTHTDAFCAALADDFGVRSIDQSRLFDVAVSIETLRHTMKHFERWMRPERRSVELPMRLAGAKAWIEYQPKGVVGLMSPWNFPIHLTFTPLAGILAAGNAVMIKPSEHTPATSAVMAAAFARHFSPEEAVVVTGDADVAARFSALPFDHIIFTGSTTVGRHVMRAAAENLVPLTLELGGKSPVIVGRDPDLTLMANRIITGKMLNAGQICLAPDYLLVPDTNKARIVDALLASARAIYPDPAANPDYAAVRGERNRARLRAYVDEAKALGAQALTHGGEGLDGRMPFTLLVDCPPECGAMRDEIFGPVLPVIGYRTLDEAIAFVNARPRPLGLYFFGGDRSEQRAVLDRTVSGGVTLNDVIFHVTVEDLPFGGVGASGFGVYHGRDGFRTFSHAKSILRQSRFDLAALAGFRPPYGRKLRRFVDKIIRART